MFQEQEVRNEFGDLISSQDFSFQDFDLAFCPGPFQAPLDPYVVVPHVSPAQLCPQVPEAPADQRLPNQVAAWCWKAVVSELSPEGIFSRA